jgi:hypothetical protein
MDLTVSTPDLAADRQVSVRRSLADAAGMGHPIHQKFKLAYNNAKRAWLTKFFRLLPKLAVITNKVAERANLIVKLPRIPVALVCKPVKVTGPKASGLACNSFHKSPAHATTAFGLSHKQIFQITTWRDVPRLEMDQAMGEPDEPARIVFGDERKKSMCAF